MNLLNNQNLEGLGLMFATPPRIVKSFVTFLHFSYHDIPIVITFANIQFFPAFGVSANEGVFRNYTVGTICPLQLWVAQPFYMCHFVFLSASSYVSSVVLDVLSWQQRTLKVGPDDVNIFVVVGAHFVRTRKYFIRFHPTTDVRWHHWCFNHKNAKHNATNNANKKLLYIPVVMLAWYR